MAKIIVIGAGAAGMMAAITAAENGHTVSVFEKNEKPGKKLYITGKGRCNLANECDDETFFSVVKKNPRFLYSAYGQFSAYDTLAFFKKLGLEIKTERGNRVFPVSDKSSDVIRVLEQKMKDLGVTVHYRTTVDKVLEEAGHFAGIRTESKSIYHADACIIATGGLSYPSTGSTGDGYRFAKEVGHQVTELSPSLVAILVKEKRVKQLEGLSLKNVNLSVISPAEKKGKTIQKEVFHGFGEMLFTAEGVSGPLCLSASSELASGFSDGTYVEIDLKPALTMEQLEQRVLNDFKDNINRQFRNSLGALLPARMAEYIIEISGIDPYVQVNSVTQQERRHLCELIKKLRFTVEKLGGYREAVITRGGINVKEINPATMESKLVSGLYFAGEVLDLDALTGGFNLQIAWTTGYVAGNSAGSSTSCTV